MDNTWIPLDFEKTNGIGPGGCGFIPLAGGCFQKGIAGGQSFCYVAVSMGCIYSLENEIQTGEAAPCGIHMISEAENQLGR